MLRKIAGVFLGCTFLIHAAFAQVGEVKKTTLVTIPGTFEIKAPVDRVWKLISTADSFGVLSGFQPSEKSKRLGTVGASVSASIWNDKGRLVTTYSDPEKELRVTWEPEGGHYLCAKRIVLTPSTNGTTVKYWDRYTDDQPADSVEKTLKQTTEETRKAIAAFIALAEK